MQLADFHIHIAEAVPAIRQESGIGRVIRTGQDCAEAVRGRIVLTGEELQLVQPLLFEDDGALGALYFPAKAAFVSPGDAAGTNVAMHAVLELHKCRNHVVIVDRLAAAFVLRVLTLAMDNGDVADNTLDGRAGQVVRDADDMAENVAIGTGARLIARHAPGPGTRFVRLVIDVIAAEEGRHPSDGAALDQPAGMGDSRILGVVVADDRLAGTAACGLRHRLRIAEPCRHRLFTPHMFAGCERGN